MLDKNTVLLVPVMYFVKGLQMLARKWMKNGKKLKKKSLKRLGDFMKMGFP